MPGAAPRELSPAGTELPIPGHVPFPLPFPAALPFCPAPADPDSCRGLPGLIALLRAQVRHGRGVAVAVATERARRGWALQGGLGQALSPGPSAPSTGNKNKPSDLRVRQSLLVIQRVRSMGMAPQNMRVSHRNF